MSRTAAPQLRAMRWAKARRLRSGWCLDSYPRIWRFAKTIPWSGDLLTVPGSEFWNRLSFPENWNWSACAVSDFDSLGVYSQVPINGRQEVSYANSSVDCVLSSTIRGTDKLSSGDATSAE